MRTPFTGNNAVHINLTYIIKCYLESKSLITWQISGFSSPLHYWCCCRPHHSATDHGRMRTIKFNLVQLATVQYRRVQSQVSAAVSAIAGQPCRTMIRLLSGTRMYDVDIWQMNGGHPSGRIIQFSRRPCRTHAHIQIALFVLWVAIQWIPRRHSFTEHTRLYCKRIE